ncbi:MAG: hypothetical protein JWN43_1096 [Gammaproteobacteria bacterium]|nr:hypothetical protein [Gammaproteobacteria bacterium]
MLSFQSTSLAAAVIVLIGYAAYRRLARGAPLDVRSQIRAETYALRMALEDLVARLDMERRSRTAAAEARGDLTKEEFRQWFAELEADESELKQLESQVPADTDFHDLSAVQLDITLLEILASSWRANGLAEKYQAAPPAAQEGGRRLDPGPEETATGHDRDMDLIGPRPFIA